MRKLTVCIGENKGTEQLCGNCETDQRLYIRSTDGTSHLYLNPKFRLIAFFYDCAAVLRRTWSETQTVGFLMRRLISQSDNGT